MGLKLHGTPVSMNTVRVMAALNELGLEYELVPVDLQTGAHKRPPFIGLNPFGQVPALEDGEVTLFESRACNRYLLKTYAGSGPDLLLTAGTSAEKAAVEVWLEVEAQHFNQPASLVIFEALVKPILGMQTDPAAMDKEGEKLSSVLDVYEARLAQSKYLAGGEFSLADLNHLPNLSYVLKTPKASLITSRPHVKAWYEDISARPAWKKTTASLGGGN